MGALLNWKHSCSSMVSWHESHDLSLSSKPNLKCRTGSQEQATDHQQASMVYWQTSIEGYAYRDAKSRSRSCSWLVNNCHGRQCGLIGLHLVSTWSHEVVPPLRLVTPIYGLIPNIRLPNQTGFLTTKSCFLFTFTPLHGKAFERPLYSTSTK